MKYIIVFLISMVPIIELRGAIPIGVGAFHLNYVEAFLCSFIGNIIPVYFIVKYIRPLFDFFGRWKPFKKIIDWASEKANKHIAENNKLQMEDGWNEGTSFKHNEAEYVTFSLGDGDTPDATLVVVKTMLEGGVS